MLTRIMVLVFSLVCSGPLVWCSDDEGAPEENNLPEERDDEEAEEEAESNVIGIPLAALLNSFASGSARGEDGGLVRKTP